MKALLVVDYQEDFISGSLAVAGAEGIREVIKEKFAEYYDNLDLIVATIDYHPENHSSFVEQGGPWPKHCVKGTFGCQFGLPMPDDKPQAATPLIPLPWQRRNNASVKYRAAHCLSENPGPLPLDLSACKPQ